MSLAQRILIIAVHLAVPAILAGCAGDSAPDPAQRVTAWLYAGEVDSLDARVTPELRRRLEERGSLDVLCERVIGRLTPEVETLDRTTFRRGNVTHVVRTVTYAQDPSRPRSLWVAVDDAGFIHRLSLRLADEVPCGGPSRPRITLRLPFEGAWTVLHSGRIREQNIHAMDPRQCYGVEWHQVRNGASHRGEGTANADYFAYGREVLAPASGVVVGLEAGVPENVPGKPNYGRPGGNSVVVDHRTGEYSVVGGLQGSSIRVALGDTVVAGDVLGLCGNNGLSREPKVHLHLQSGVRDGDGLPLGFAQVRVDGARRPIAFLTAGQVTESLWLGSTSAAQH